MMCIAEAGRRPAFSRRLSVAGKVRFFKGALFMRLIGFAACVLASVILVACQSQPPAPPSPTVSDDQFGTFKDAYKAIPGCVVGRVGYVMSDQSRLTVVDIPAHSVVRDDVFTIEDANRQKLADGYVETVDSAGTMAAVRYEMRPGAPRAPVANDIAIHMPLNQ